jgi:hypothetical protein
MAKDKRISELPGISSVAVVALNRMGILTASDLVAADFDRLAFVLEDFAEATRLVGEARKCVEARKGSKIESAAPSTPGPLMSGTLSHTPRTALRIGREAKGTPKMQKQDDAMGSALAAAAMSTGNDPNWRGTLQRRLCAAGVLLEHEGTQQEVAASLLLEIAETGSVEQMPRLSQDLEQVLEECIALRAVPVSPSGKLPRYFLDMASSASTSARRVCAAAVIAAVEHGVAFERVDFHMEALAAGSDEAIVARALEAVGLKRAA